MSELAKQKYISRNGEVPEIRGHGKATNKKPLQPVADQKLDSKAIERAVYDGMQDLRAKKSR